MVYENILDTIGNTPVIKLKENKGADIYVKAEYFNPAGSIKDRAAYYIVEDMISENKLAKGDKIVEATSGNTGVGLAMVGAVLGYEVIIYMPETASVERRKLMEQYGAKVILTDGKKGMKGSIEEAERLTKKDGYVMAGQFTNMSNVKAHYETTAKEIEKDMNDVDAIVAGVGTGGTITGIGKYFKEKGLKAKIIAVEPEKSAVLSGKEPSPHKIQGIGAGFVPDILDLKVIDEVVTVKDEEALQGARDLGSKEGMIVGISSGAAYIGALKVSEKLGKGKKILFIAPDTGERYFSTELYKNEK